MAYFDLELDDSDKKFSQTEDQTNNQKSKIKNSKTEEQVVFMYEITELGFENTWILFFYLQASACF